MIRFQSEVGRVLRKIREEQGLTRAQLSEKSTVSERQISAIELGEKGPRLNSLELLLRSLGASADQLFIRNCPKMIPRLHRSCILQGSAMRGKAYDCCIHPNAAG